MKKENTTEKILLTTNEVCKMLGVTRSTLLTLEKKEDFPKAILILSQKKWKKSEIDEYLEKKRVK